MNVVEVSKLLGHESIKNNYQKYVFLNIWRAGINSFNSNFTERK